MSAYRGGGDSADPGLPAGPVTPQVMDVQAALYPRHDAPLGFLDIELAQVTHLSKSEYLDPDWGKEKKYGT